jgi:hypothetical protein
MTDPGFVKQDDDINYLEVLESVDINSICPDSRLIKPPRAKYCMVCNRCVDRFDHHCPWLNICVGRNNLKFFQFYIFTHVLLLFTVIISLLLYMEVKQD